VHEIGIADLDARNIVQDAVYDTNILCADCDGSFSQYEKYFSDLVSNELISSNKISLQSKHEYIEFNVDKFANVDHFALRKFFLVTIWRCAISKRDNYRHVDLDSNNEWLREMILSKSLTNDNYTNYSAVLVSLEDVDDIRTETVIFPQPAMFGKWPVIILMVNRFAIIYNLTPNETPFLFQYQLNRSGFFDVVRFTHDSGLTFLDKLTRNQTRVRRSSVVKPLEGVK
jgi:hypothetical protein